MISGRASIHVFAICAFAVQFVSPGNASFGAERRFAVPHVTLPLMAKPPTVDGTIEDGEWTGAARMADMVRAGHTTLEAREAVSWLGSDGARVYFAVKSEMPPSGKLTANVKPMPSDRDARTIQDDGVEVWLDPHHGKKGRGMYQGIFNSLGAIYDSQHEPAGNWRGDWQLESKTIDGWWHFEGSVSLKSLGVRGSILGQTWGVRLIRNWQTPRSQTDWAPLAVQFASRDTMSVVRWQANAPVVQMMAIRRPDGKKAQYTVRIRNPQGQPLHVRIRIDSQPDSSQHAYLAETHVVGAGKAKDVVLDHPACHEEEKIYTRVHADSPDGRAVYFHREFMWTLSRPANAWGESREVLGPVARIKRALLFHASFDDGPDADFARGNGKAKPARAQGTQLKRIDGMTGKALLCGEGCAGLQFENAKNFNIREGTVSMWVRPVRWAKTDGDMSHAFFMNGRPGKGYLGFQMCRFNRPRPYVQFYMIQYPYRGSVHISTGTDVAIWKPDEWHWIVTTWKEDQVTLYVDGLVRGRKGIDPPLSERDLTWPDFRVGRTGGRDQTAIDEVKIFDRCLTEPELRMAKAFCRSSAGAAAWEAVQLDFAHYPYHKKVKARVDINGLQGKESVRAARLALRRAGGSATLAAIEMPTFENNVTEVVADVPDLASGRYSLALQLKGGPKALQGELVREFERRRFEWERNEIGKSDLILPPFTPIRVKGRTVSTVLRDHVMNDFGLWDQVVAKGEPILAGPIRFEAWADGRRVEIKPGKLAFARRSETRVSVRAQWSAGRVRAEVASQIDYDGMMLSTLKLTGPGDLDRLDLVVPVKDSMAPLAHMVGERCRGNFAGYLPKGDGVIWDSRKTIKHDLIGPFCPYVWVGAEERGICWFAENDRGWAVEEKTPCQQVERSDGGVVMIRVRIIQQPTRLPKSPSRRIVFGLQATPVKPMPSRPANWRAWTAGPEAPGAMTFTIAGSTHYIGSLIHEPFPFKRDLTLWKKFAESRKTGKRDRAFAKQWVDSYPKEVFKAYPYKQYLASIRGGFFMVSRQPQRMLVYVQGRGITFRNPEFQTFQDEWTMEDYNSRVWPMGYADRRGYATDPVPSWQDFRLWWLKKQMETFTDGLYFDNFFMIPMKDRVVSSAYKRADGRVQPAVSCLKTRRMMRRTSVMYLEAGRHPMIAPHMTNSTIMPMMAFAQFCLDWEWHYGRSDFQSRWSRDHIRAACTGRQAGCAPVVIGIGARGGSADEVEWLHRTFNGVVLTHELIPCWYTTNTLVPLKERRQRTTSRDLYHKTRALLFAIGIGSDACRTYNYWEKDYPLTVEGIESSGIVHRGKGKTVIIVTDWGDGGGGVRLTLDTGRLKLKPGFEASDFETGQPIPRSGRALTFALKKHDYRTIVIDD